LAEEEYAHAKHQHEEIGLVFKYQLGINVYGPAQAHAGQRRICRPVACNSV